MLAESLDSNPSHTFTEQTLQALLSEWGSSYMEDAVQGESTHIATASKRAVSMGPLELCGDEAVAGVNSLQLGCQCAPCLTPGIQETITLCEHAV